MKARGFLLASIVSLITFLASDELRADSWPPPRTGEFYDKPLVLRDGIDDLGMSFGQFVSCVEQTIEFFVAQGRRSHTPVTVTSSGNRVTMFMYGATGDEIHLRFSNRPGYIILDSVEIPGKFLTDYGFKFLSVSYLTSTCS